MFSELDTLLTAVPGEANKTAYDSAIVEDNVFGKPTVATRKLTAQRLSELYALDGAVPVFRVLRRLWRNDSQGRPHLAFLCALARDPLLRATVETVISLVPGEELSRQKMTNALNGLVGDRMNPATLDKVVRNVSSSWTQSGHLQGRARKFRQIVRPTPPSASYAFVLGYLQGIRGLRLFETLWTRILDVTVSDLRPLAMEAKRLGLLDLKIAGDVVEIGFSNLLTSQEIKDSRVTH